jgi:nucleotide-binding universal stress UspA family protein
VRLPSAILVPLDGSEISQRSLGCARWLASRLGAPLHVLHSTGEPAADILAAIEQHRIETIVMTGRGESAADVTHRPFEPFGHIARAVIERSPVPVLVVPRGYEEVLPWRSALVPLSGEVETDQALTLALRLATALDFVVSVAHVVEDDDARGPTWASADAAHHEYPEMLNELVARACPLCSPAERRRIGAVRLLRGDVARELLEQQQADVVVAGWHGFLEAGHAQVLKTLLQHLRSPMLLMKRLPKQHFRLKIGDALEAAR